MKAVIPGVGNRGVGGGIPPWPEKFRKYPPEDFGKIYPPPRRREAPPPFFGQNSKINVILVKFRLI